MKITDVREIIYFSYITKNSICAEIGVHRGINAEKIMKYNPKKLYLIDCWDCQKEYLKEKNVIVHSHAGASVEKQSRWYEEVKEKFNTYDSVEVIREYSNNVVNRFQDKYFDLIYIDGLHDYSSVLEDVTLWSGKIKDNGFILCDDYEENNERGYGVIPAVTEFLKNNKTFIGQELRDGAYVLKRR